VEELAGPGQGTSFAQHDPPTTPDSCDVGYVSIDMLLDELLLEIFYFMCVGDDYKEECKPTWEMLVHVCRRWRYTVFAAPRRLDLRLVCTAGTPVDRMLDVWPALPIVIRVNNRHRWINNNIIAALKHNSRISEIYVESLIWRGIRGSKELGEVIREDPYPALTDLHFWSHDYDYTAPDLPYSFLRGSAPHLRSLRLDNVAFSALPRLVIINISLIELQAPPFGDRKDP